jgi:hypothetical protein
MRNSLGVSASPTALSPSGPSRNLRSVSSAPPLRSTDASSGWVDDFGRHSCPDCGFIWEACECDLTPYRGAFETEGRH